VTEKDQCVIGIDGGASSTKAALMREGLIVMAEGRGGPADHFSEEMGRERLERALRAAVFPLSSFLNEREDLSLKAVFLGLSGVSIPGKRQAAAQILAEVFPGVPVRVESDALIAWAGALSGQSGITVIAGTGSVAYGRTSDGKEARKGGFGYLFGDEGGGFYVACQGVRAALSHHDKIGPATSLTEVLPGLFGVSSVAEIPGKVYSESMPVEEIAKFATAVALEARKGDPVSIEIMNHAGRSLGKLAVSCLSELDPEVPLISYVGGVFDAGDIILEPFKDEILSRRPDAVVIPPRYPPFVGAGILAWNPALLKRRKGKDGG